MVDKVRKVKINDKTCFICIYIIYIYTLRQPSLLLKSCTRYKNKSCQLVSIETRLKEKKKGWIAITDPFSPPLLVFPSCVEAFFGQPRGVDDGQTADITSPRGYNLREQYQRWFGGVQRGGRMYRDGLLRAHLHRPTIQLLLNSRYPSTRAEKTCLNRAPTLQRKLELPPNSPTKWQYNYYAWKKLVVSVEHYFSFESKWTLSFFSKTDTLLLFLQYSRIL